MGQKAAEMLRLLPDAGSAVIERCSGHGGSWGVMKENFETALKVGKPVARQARATEAAISPRNARSPACISCRDGDAGERTSRVPRADRTTRSSLSRAPTGLTASAEAGKRTDERRHDRPGGS